MPHLACWSCGRSMYTVSPLESLFAEERRCPRCGAFLQYERRVSDRRVWSRRVNATHVPGPPASDRDRREAERRNGQRRRRADSVDHRAVASGWARG